MKASDFCEVCSHDDVARIGKVLDNLVVMEMVNGSYTLAMLDSADHIEPIDLTFTIAPTEGVLEIEEGDHDLYIQDMDEEDDLDVHLNNMDLLDKTYTMDVSVELVRSALKAGFNFDEHNVFSVWLYNEIGKTVDLLSTETD